MILVRQSLQLFWNICLLRTSYERIPPYFVFTFLVVLFYSIVKVIFNGWIFEDNWNDAIINTVIFTIVIISCIWILLIFKNAGQFFQATTVAVLGQDALMTLFYSPVRWMTFHIENQPLLSMFFIGILYLISGWDLAIKGYILQKALNTERLLGIFLALTILLLAIMATVKW